jgi:hypothetical protein
MKRIKENQVLKMIIFLYHQIMESIIFDKEKKSISKTIVINHLISILYDL